MKKQKEYALYRGDEFIDLGTKKYLSQKHNIAIDTITFYKSPIYLSRIKHYDRRFRVIEIEDEEDNWNSRRTEPSSMEFRKR